MKISMKYISTIIALFLMFGCSQQIPSDDFMNLQMHTNMNGIDSGEYLGRNIEIPVKKFITGLSGEKTWSQGNSDREWVLKTKFEDKATGKQGSYTLVYQRHTNKATGKDYAFLARFLVGERELSPGDVANATVQIFGRVVAK